MRPYFRAVRWVLSAQIAMIGTVSLGASAMGGWLDARSALFGGLTAFLPNLYFAARFGFSDSSRSAKEIIRIFYLGETIKLILTAVLFIIVFQLPDIRFLPLFTGFTAVIMVFWFALLVSGTDF